MTRDVARAIHGTSAVAAGIAAILSPIPLLDELILFPAYGLLAKRIGKAHGLAWSSLPLRPIARTAFNGLVARAGLNLLVAYIPGVAAVANAASAVALTELFGRWVDETCDAPADARPLGVKDIASRLREMASQVAGAGASANPA